MTQQVALYVSVADTSAADAAWQAVYGVAAVYMVARTVGGQNFMYAAALLDIEQETVLRNAVVGIGSAELFICENRDFLVRRLIDSTSPGGIPHKNTANWTYANTEEALVDSPITTSRAVVYVSPMGLSSNDGSLENPVDIDTALLRYPIAATSEIRFLTGMYTLTVSINFDGDGLLITSASGFMDVAIQCASGVRLQIYATSTWEHLEISGLYGTRIINVSGQLPEIVEEFPDLTVYGDNVVFRHCYIHDLFNLLWTSSAAGGIIEECVLGMFGYQGLDRGHGHLWYSQHTDTVATRIMRRCVLIPSYGGGVRAFASNETVTIRRYLVEDSTHIQHEILTGAQGPIDAVTIDNNWTINDDIQMGYEPTAANGAVIATNNRIIALDTGNPIRVNCLNFDAVTFRNNQVVSYDYTGEVDPPHYLIVAQGNPTIVDWDANNYFVQNDALFYEWGIDWGTFTEFKSNALGGGIDATSGFQTTFPTQNTIDIIPCTLGWLAIIRILNFANDEFVTIDLSGLGLVNGQDYVLRSVYDLSVDSLTFTYSSAEPTVEVDMRPANRSTAMPFGANSPLAMIRQWFGCFVLEST